uniref:DUF3866 family protein n=1 Tax=Ornithinimicrobium sp. CNJ-824 TaxID=1904966 RepID=UPI000AD82719
MIRWRQGVVRATGPGWPGVLLLDVDTSDGESLRALAYPDVVGTPRTGDRVLLNTTALDRSLGTGGLALVVAVPDRPDAWPAREAEEPGHLVKARYTPLQTMVLGVDDPEGAHHGGLADATTSGVCRCSPRTCTRRCRRCWPGSGWRTRVFGWSTS